MRKDDRRPETSGLHGSDCVEFDMKRNIYKNMLFKDCKETDLSMLVATNCGLIYSWNLGCILVLDPSHEHHVRQLHASRIWHHADYVSRVG